MRRQRRQFGRSRRNGWWKWRIAASVVVHVYFRDDQVTKSIRMEASRLLHSHILADLVPAPEHVRIGVHTIRR